MNRLNIVGAALGLILLLACGAQEPAEPEVKFAEGRQLIEDGAYEEALEYFEGKIASTPEEPEAHFLAGQAAAMGANFDAAEAHLNKAIELSPETAAYYDWLGRTYGGKARSRTLMEQLQMAPKIKENFAKAVELDPGNLEAKFFLGTFYVMAPPAAGGDITLGRSIAEELKAEDPVSGTRLMAQSFVSARKPAEAVPVYEEVLALAPEDPQSHSDLASVYLTLKDEQKTIEHLDKALELNPNFKAALMNYGEAATRWDAYLDKGVASMEKLLALDRDILSPNPAHARYVLGTLYEMQGNLDQAVEMYEAAAGMDHFAAGKRLSELQAEEAPTADESASSDETTTSSEATESAPAEE